MKKGYEQLLEFLMEDDEAFENKYLSNLSGEEKREFEEELLKNREDMTKMCYNRGTNSDNCGGCDGRRK